MKKTKSKATHGEGLYLVLVSVHGLIRGNELELGRDADTGGQTKYIVELTQALAAHPEVGRVDLLTRRIQDQRVAADYAKPEEQLGEKARIIRLECGPRRYLYKESLWPYLPCFADNALKHIRSVGLMPDVVHGHYADAGYVGVRIAHLLGVPLVQTGHSLGRIKRERLLEKGLRDDDIEQRYNISTRIEAEEEVLANAYMIIASTRQEVEQQYAVYDHYQPKRMVVIPPGTDLGRFYPPRLRSPQTPLQKDLSRFLTDLNKPIILALSRPDERKNIITLIRAYAEHENLRQKANLVIIAGNRERIRRLEKGARDVLTDILMLIDDYDLYGHVAYPKQHAADDVPEFYRMVTRTRGVFVNPALTEPFGLTLIEAAASGAPIVATHDGGPQEIISNCHNGILIDPLDTKAIAEAIDSIISNRNRWREFSEQGLRGVKQHYSWAGHANKYIKHIKGLRREATRHRKGQQRLSGKLAQADRALISDIDNTLLGDRSALRTLLHRLREQGKNALVFGIATGRRLDSALEILKEWGVPLPDVLITSVGSEIYYGPEITQDMGWFKHIDHQWKPDKLRTALLALPGVALQPEIDQRRHKLSFFIDPKQVPDIKEIERILHQQDLQANLIYSHDRYLDLLPTRASKGFAVRYFADKWGIPTERILVAGDSGNDEDMLRGSTLGVVVGNHHPELEKLHGFKKVYFASANYAGGIDEALTHYDFFGCCDVPAKHKT